MWEDKLTEDQTYNLARLWDLWLSNDEDSGYCPHIWRVNTDTKTCVCLICSRAVQSNQEMYSAEMEGCGSQ